MIKRNRVKKKKKRKQNYNRFNATIIRRYIQIWNTINLSKIFEKAKKIYEFLKQRSAKIEINRQTLSVSIKQKKKRKRERKRKNLPTHFVLNEVSSNRAEQISTTPKNDAILPPKKKKGKPGQKQLVQNPTLSTFPNKISKHDEKDCSLLSLSSPLTNRANEKFQCDPLHDQAQRKREKRSRREEKRKEGEKKRERRGEILFRCVHGRRAFAG